MPSTQQQKQIIITNYLKQITKHCNKIKRTTISLSDNNKEEDLKTIKTKDSNKNKINSQKFDEILYSILQIQKSRKKIQQLLIVVKVKSSSKDNCQYGYYQRNKEISFIGDINKNNYHDNNNKNSYHGNNNKQQYNQQQIDNIYDDQLLSNQAQRLINNFDKTINKLGRKVNIMLNQAHFPRKPMKSIQYQHNGHQQRYYYKQQKLLKKQRNNNNNNKQQHRRNNNSNNNDNNNSNNNKIDEQDEQQQYQQNSGMYNDQSMHVIDQQLQILIEQFKIESKKEKEKVKYKQKQKDDNRDQNRKQFKRQYYQEQQQDQQDHPVQGYQT